MRTESVVSAHYVGVAFPYLELCRGDKLDTSCSSLIAKFTVISCQLWNGPSRLERTVGGFRVWNRFRSVIL